MRPAMGHFLSRIILWARAEKPLLILVALTCVMIVLIEGLQHKTYSNHFGSGHGYQPREDRGDCIIKPGKALVEVPYVFQRWRSEFCRIEKPYDGHGLVRGIFLGDASAIEPEVSDLFRTAGLSHLLAASGFNCWIAAMAFGIVARIMLWLFNARLPALAALRSRKYATPVARFLGAWLFWLWTDQSPPITRSVATISAKSALDGWRLPVPFLRLLIIQYLVSMLLAPILWKSVSFQLTFGCLFGIIVFPPMFERFKPKWCWTSIWEYFATGLGACLGTIPTTYIAFGTINFSSLTTNWFAVPLVSVAIMPLALIVMLFAPLSQLTGLGFIVKLSAMAAGACATLLLSALQWWTSVVPALLITFD